MRRAALGVFPSAPLGKLGNFELVVSRPRVWESSNKRGLLLTARAPALAIERHPARVWL